MMIRTISTEVRKRRRRSVKNRITRVRSWEGAGTVGFMAGVFMAGVFMAGMFMAWVNVEQGKQNKNGFFIMATGSGCIVRWCITTPTGRWKRLT
jgi:hypothetical protein